MKPTKALRDARKDLNTLRTRLSTTVASLELKERELQDCRLLRGEQGTKITSLQQEGTLLRDEIVRLKKLPPSAHHPRARRVVPLTYWADSEILFLLHSLESTRAQAKEYPPTGVDGLGQPVNDSPSFPTTLYAQVVEECQNRQLIGRAGASLFNVAPQTGQTGGGR